MCQVMLCAMSEIACGSPPPSPQSSSLLAYPRDKKRPMNDMLRKSTVCPFSIYANGISHKHPEMNWEAQEALHEMECDIDWGVAHDTTDMEVDEAVGTPW